MNNNLQDSNHRQRALDPMESFIVQAPAGSGKTELLTQRFLTLLGHVNAPEEILAITFTKKSAAEMRDRIITALEDAIDETPIESSHKQATRKLALNALAQNRAKNWNLIENPNRLRIQTIDSFNAWLARRLPILSQFGSAPEIADNPTLLYQEAIHEFLSHLEEETAWSDSIEKLLVHLDNDLSKVEALLMRMLKKRDQWLPYITLNADDPLLRKKLEENLINVVTNSLSNLHQSIPSEYTNELVSLANIAAQNVVHEKPDSPIVYCKDLLALPGDNIETKNIWLGLSELLLTKEFEWRKTFNKNIGFPPSSKSAHPQEKIYLKEIQERIKGFIEKLSSHDKIRLAFKELSYAPDPCYQDKQWDILAALHQTLKVVVAQLKLVFQQHGKIDYIENAQAALLALGPDEHPTDLALALDYKIQHLLVDEFQDTSNSQFRLLEKLTSQWEVGDGRTLFLVGDPMQSIYRFREAEVGLFIRSRKKGIHHIHLEPLTLSVNFRSTPNMVEWVNEHFQSVLPAYEDIATGAITFCSSTAAKQAIDIAAVTLHPLFNREDCAQAEAIVSIIKNIKEKNPAETIAILVRSRNNLKHIIPALRKNNLPYQAINIDPLTTRPVVQDLIALTKSLLHPADRIAWLSILRAPWCGLLLSDLFIIAKNSTTETIFERLQNQAVFHELSQDAKTRLSRIIPILQQRIFNRCRLTLRDWVESTWHLIGGPACVNEWSELEDASTFFKLLEKLDEGADLSRFDDLDEAIEKLFASPDHHADQSLQIMTIHNAKGLEFDTVILPHLESKTPYDEKQLLLWMERRSLAEASQLLIAPVHAIGDENDPIYDYIKRQHAIKSDFESGRLLYVAATRAKKQLHLFFSLDTKANSDHLQLTANSLLEKLWPAIKNTVHEQFSKQPLNPTTSSSSLIATEIKRIKRLVSHWENTIKLPVEVTALHQTISGFHLQSNNPKFIGTLIHRILENICKHNDTWWQSVNQSNKVAYIEKQLLQLGMLPEAIPSAIETILLAIDNTLKDPRGRWIIHPHQAAQSEFAMTTLVNQSPQQLVIDRTFIDESGIRWIIDYKSSRAEDLPIDIFLAEEYKKYALKMRNYHAAMQELDNRPIRLGLYFPLIPEWYEWDIND